MARMNSCPQDKGQLEFYGISRRLTGETIMVDGDPVPYFEMFRWQECSTCGLFTKEDFYGRILGEQKEPPDKKLFERKDRKNDD